MLNIRRVAVVMLMVAMMGVPVLIVVVHMNGDS